MLCELPAFAEASAWHSRGQAKDNFKELNNEKELTICDF
jgi:hypothetical protein